MVLPTGPIGTWGMVPGNFNWFALRPKLKIGNKPGALSLFTGISNRVKNGLGEDLQGNSYIQNQVAWNSRTPSGVDKVYRISESPLSDLINGTFVTLTEGQMVIKADYSGSFFEAFSTERFGVIFVPAVLDKDNVGASAEQSVINPCDPKAYTLAAHSNVIALGRPLIRHPKLIGTAWYIKVPTGGILNKVVKPFLAKQAVNYTGMPTESAIPIVDIIIQTGPATAVSYAHRKVANIVTAEASPSFLK